MVDDVREPSSAYAAVARENRWALERATDASGRTLELIDLYEANEAGAAKPEVFCASYTNFYLADGAVIMPAYGMAADQGAAATLARVFPGREVVPVRINHLACGGGGVHCITQQQPACPQAFHG